MGVLCGEKPVDSVSSVARIGLTMKNTTQKTRSLPLRARAFRLRCAGLAETLRLKYELTMLAVAS